jgi:hypothetical protein
MMSRLKKRRILFILVVVAMVFALPGISLADDGLEPFITLDDGVPEGSSVKGIINSGDSFGEEFLFEGIPDGIGLAPGPSPDTVNVFVAHEQSTVPFRNQADFQDASVSKLTLDTNTAAVLHAEVAIGPENGYLRFCSASMAGPAEGFSRYTFFANEETNDIVDVPEGAPYESDPALGGQRQGGYAVVLDAESESGDFTFTQVAGMGRHNHENTIALPGWNQIALLSTDDTFNAPSAQLYLYLANHESHVWQDKGSLWAFRVTRTDDGPINPNDPFNGANDYLDLQPGDDWQGEFIRVPKQIARGLTDEAPQDALENWSNEHNVFQFIRLEDLAYDKNDPRVVYVADTGRSRIVPDDETGRMKRGPGGTTGLADNGRIFKFEFNENNPRKVDSFSVFADADVPESDPVFAGFVNPDNLDTSANSMMVQEDADEAKIWRYDFGSGAWSLVATVKDPDGESSGIVDASEWFGAGAWLLDVQGHGNNVAEEQVGDVLLKRESGQLLLMIIPGS